MNTDEQIFFANKIKQPGFVFAYPTEAVYGLGCNPFDEAAINHILSIKKRPSHQRFILIASHWKQILPLIQSIEETLLEQVKASWPGPFTWVFPASDTAPSWLVDKNNTIALRLTAHPIASQLCQIANIPLISTSANLSGESPCRTYEETRKIFSHLVDYIIDGSVNHLLNPTPIRDVLTGQFLRK